MGSTWSTASVPETDLELEANILLDATQIKRKKNRTAVYSNFKNRSEGGPVGGIPKYAIPIEVQKPVRAPGWGYGFVTHTFKGLPVDYAEHPTIVWQKANPQDNALYYIVRMQWPKGETYWVKALDVTTIQESQLIVDVDYPEIERSNRKDIFELSTDTKVTNILGDVVSMGDLQPVQQAAINFTFAYHCNYKKKPT